MKLKKVLFIVCILGIVVSGFAQNPIIQTNYTADPAPMVYNDTVFLYTTHDEDETVNNFFTMNDWKCYSSTDMVNWKDHGTVLSYSDFGWSRGDAWAGQCIYRNGKFYFYVPVNQKNGGNAIGVAVSDSPTGPFKDALGGPLLVGYGYIDPTVFIDDDGQAYLYWGNPNLYYVKLNEDMVSYDETVGVVQIPLTVEGFGARANNSERNTSYEEGPWFFKRNDIYYMLYPAGGVPEHLAYSTSTGPTGPWVYGDTIMAQISNKGAFTNHPGYISYKGKSYLFYHNAALPGGGGFKRSVCVDEFEFNADGSIPLIAPTSGVQNAVENLNPYQENQAETIAWEEGVEIGSNNGTDIYVTGIDNGDYIKVRSVDFGEEGAAAFTASVACETKPGISKGGAIEIHLDNIGGSLVGTIPVSYTGGLNNWMNETTAISGAIGIHDVYFVFKAETDDVFNFNKWSFTPKLASRELIAINAITEKYKIDILSENNTANVEVIAIYSDGSVENVTSKAVYGVQEEGLISISNEGVLTGIGYGTETLNVEFEGFSDTLKIIVKNLESELTVKRLIANPDNVELLSGNTSSIVITAEFLDGHQEDVTNLATLSNPNSKVATIANGIITAKNKGEIAVTASYKGQMGEAKSTSINIKVVNRSPYFKNEAEDFSDQSGIQTETCSDVDGGDNIGFIENGDWIKIDALDFDEGTSLFEARIASSTSGGAIEIRLNSSTGELIGTCTVPATGGWQSWETQSCEVGYISGIHDVYLVFKGGSGYLFNMNWWKFTAGTTSSNNTKYVNELYVVSEHNQKYLKGVLPNDRVTIYTSSGQKIRTYKTISDETQLTGPSGIILIEVKRGREKYNLKTILE